LFPLYNKSRIIAAFVVPSKGLPPNHTLFTFIPKKAAFVAAFNEKPLPEINK
jgi:hypothetical protein